MNLYGSYSDKLPLSDGPENNGPAWGVINARALIRSLIAGFLIIGFTLSSLPASQENWRIVRYSLEEGLSQISVNCIIKDSYGYLWVGTQDGLNRFDGYGFDIYRHQPSDPQSLSNSNIQSVIECNEGNIWVGTQDGLNMFDRRTNTFMVYRNEPGNSESPSDNNIYYLYQDRTGIIWLKTERGIDRFDPETERFTHFEHYYDPFNYVADSDYNIIYEDNKDRLWVGSKDGLFFFDRKGERFRRYYHDHDVTGSISSNMIKCIFETSGGDFLVGTENGLNVFDPGKEVFHSLYIEHENSSSSRLNEINTIYEDHKGTVWIGTNAGLFIFSPKEMDFTPFSGSTLSPSFFEVEVSTILEDRSNNLWAGTLGGLYMIDSKSKFKTHRIHDYMDGAAPSARFIASVLPVSDEELWLGTWGGGLFLLNSNTGEIRHYSESSPSVSESISNDFVHVIFQDSGGDIILGTRNGLDIFRGPENGFTPYCPSNDPDDCIIFNSNRVYCIFMDSEQVLWIGTRYGLHSFREGSLTSYYHDLQDAASIASNQVHDIIECGNGYIWLATADGLSRFDKETASFRNYRKDPEMGRFSLSNNELTCLHEDSNGNLWIGSVAGLNRYFPGTGSFMVFSEMEGLPNNLIYSILEDNDGNLWLSTNHGLARFDPVSFEITSFDVADGLQSYEFNLGASYKNQRGEMFFGGVAGLNSFFPDSLIFNETIPPLVFTSFEVISHEGSRFITAEDKDEIILQPHENSFNIEFAALDFTRPGKNRYEYKMEGLDDNWVYAGSRRMANFSRISSGTYLFRVRGSNNDDVWNEEGISLRIVVITPWWKSVFAWIFYTLALLFLIYLIILFSTRQLRRANQVLKDKEHASAEVSRQKEELSLKNRNITDSINYAKRIQLAMMPATRQFRRLFSESFIYHKPKDIVSGDFYWVNQINDKVFFAVIDCTGHGVPGAFMSIIGNELLRNIINVRGIEKPSEILNKLSEDFANIFDAEGEENFTFRDGMDVGFCVVDRKKAVLEFAGAFLPMYLIRDKSIIEIKGNRLSVGLMEDLTDEPFDNHSLKLEKNDILYLFSDGYPDQFGGEKGKKFKYRRFRHLLLNIHKLPFSEQEKLLDQSIVQWMGNNEQVDDILIIGVKPGLGGRAGYRKDRT